MDVVNVFTKLRVKRGMHRVSYALYQFITILCLICSLVFGSRVCSQPPNCCLIVDVALGLKSLEASDLNEQIGGTCSNV